jgi:conjugal transfer pilus assembly protein TraK
LRPGLLAVAALWWGGAAVAQDAPAPEIPSAPAAVLAAAPTAVVHAADAREISVRPGINTIIPVAIGHINRIKTPFSTAFIDTADGSEMQVRGSVIYIAPTQTRPVTMFVSEQGDESLAMSLTLVPENIPPVEVSLNFDPRLIGAGTPVPAPPSGPAIPAASGLPAMGQQDYVDEIRTVMRELALGDIPRGYTMSALGAGRYPSCVTDPGSGFQVSFERGQHFQGGSLEIVVGAVQRVSGIGRAEFKEVWCGRSAAVAAVALFPSPLMAPGDDAEVYIVLRQAAATVATDQRPRLVRPSVLGAP